MFGLDERITIEPVENNKRRIIDSSPYELILRDGDLRYVGFIHHIDINEDEEEIESTEEWDISIFKNMITEIESGYREDLDLYVVRIVTSSGRNNASEFSFRDKKSAIDLKEKLVAWRL